MCAGKEDDQSECSGSLYNAYDPFDYLYSPPSIAGSQASDPIYAAVIKASPLSPPPPPLPPRNNNGRHTTDKKVCTIYHCSFTLLYMIERIL